MGLAGFDRVQILGYSAGSIVVDMALIFDKDSLVTPSDVNAVLRTVTNEEGDLGSGLTVQLTDNAEGKVCKLRVSFFFFFFFFITKSSRVFFI